jgi:hypothetical protein
LKCWNDWLLPGRIQGRADRVEWWAYTGPMDSRRCLCDVGACGGS